MNIKALALVLLAAIPFSGVLSAQEASFKDVKQYIQQGDKMKDVKATLSIGADSMTITRHGQDNTVIPFASMTGATYDRRARQRKMLGMPMTGQIMAGSSQKTQHFLTVKYKTDAGGDFVELELGKDIAARVVSILEARSGQVVEKVGG